MRILVFSMLLGVLVSGCKTLSSDLAEEEDKIIGSEESFSRFVALLRFALANKEHKGLTFNPETGFYHSADGDRLTDRMLKDVPKMSDEFRTFRDFTNLWAYFRENLTVAERLELLAINQSKPRQKSISFYDYFMGNFEALYRRDVYNLVDENDFRTFMKANQFASQEKITKSGFQTLANFINYRPSMVRAILAEPEVKGRLNLDQELAHRLSNLVLKANHMSGSGPVLSAVRYGVEKVLGIAEDKPVESLVIPSNHAGYHGEDLTVVCVTPDTFSVSIISTNTHKRTRKRGVNLVYTLRLTKEELATSPKVICGDQRYIIKASRTPANEKPVAENIDQYKLTYPLSTTIVSRPVKPGEFTIAVAAQIAFLTLHGYTPHAITPLSNDDREIKKDIASSQIFAPYSYDHVTHNDNLSYETERGLKVSATRNGPEGQVTINLYIPKTRENGTNGSGVSANDLTNLYCNAADFNDGRSRLIFGQGTDHIGPFQKLYLSYYRTRNTTQSNVPLPLLLTTNVQSKDYADWTAGLFILDRNLKLLERAKAGTSLAKIKQAFTQRPERFRPSQYLMMLNDRAKEIQRQDQPYSVSEIKTEDVQEVSMECTTDKHKLASGAFQIKVVEIANLSTGQSRVITSKLPHLDQ